MMKYDRTKVTKEQSKKLEEDLLELSKQEDIRGYSVVCIDMGKNKKLSYNILDKEKVEQYVKWYYSKTGRNAKKHIICDEKETLNLIEMARRALENRQVLGFRRVIYVYLNGKMADTI